MERTAVVVSVFTGYLDQEPQKNGYNLYMGTKLTVKKKANFIRGGRDFTWERKLPAHRNKTGTPKR